MGMSSVIISFPIGEMQGVIIALCYNFPQPPHIYTISCKPVYLKVLICFNEQALQS